MLHNVTLSLRDTTRRLVLQGVRWRRNLRSRAFCVRSRYGAGHLWRLHLWEMIVSGMDLLQW
jgi:hypothetical protein